MGDVRQGRWTTKIEGDFVVFLIGARLQPTHPLRSMRDLGGFTRGMPQMLKYLMEHPEKGLLGYQMSGISLMNVQYWRSFEHLERFAKDDERSAPRDLALLLEAGGQGRPHGHLARDVPGPRR